MSTSPEDQMYCTHCPWIGPRNECVHFPADPHQTDFCPKCEWPVEPVQLEHPMNYSPPTGSAFIVRRKSDGKFESHSGDVRGTTIWVDDARQAFPFSSPAIPMKYLKDGEEVVELTWEPRIRPVQLSRKQP